MYNLVCKKWSFYCLLGTRWWTQEQGEEARVPDRVTEISPHDAGHDSILPLSAQRIRASVQTPPAIGPQGKRIVHSKYRLSLTVK